MTWRIPHIEIGDNVRLLKDVSCLNGINLLEGSIHEVKDYGTRYGLPFIHVESLGHDIQLQPRTYEKVEETL